jgi:hypothetical protein
MLLRSCHTVPVWNDGGRVHIAGIDEVRPDLSESVIGWANLAEIELAPGHIRTFLMVYEQPTP